VNSTATGSPTHRCIANTGKLLRRIHLGIIHTDLSRAYLTTKINGEHGTTIYLVIIPVCNYSQKHLQTPPDGWIITKYIKSNLYVNWDRPCLMVTLWAVSTWSSCLERFLPIFQTLVTKGTVNLPAIMQPWQVLAKNLSPFKVWNGRSRVEISHAPSTNGGEPRTDMADCMSLCIISGRNILCCYSSRFCFQNLLGITLMSGT
jgi:hypothetical protein